MDKYIRILPRTLVRSLRDFWLLSLDLRDRFRGTGDDLIPPRSLHYVGDGDFKAVGQRFLRHFVDICGLQPDETILDIGCGTGRMAIPLLRYVDESGSYIGFDVSQKAIRWCNEQIHARNMNFTFHHADIYSNEYHQKGRIPAYEYRFPCDDESIDFAFASSLFTHLREKEVDHYLSEIRRVLKPTGRALLNFFIIDETARCLMAKGEAHLDFSVVLPDCYTIDAQTPERAVAYEETKIMQSLSKAKLQLISPVFYGGWSGRPPLLDDQDIVYVTRAVE